MKYNKYLIEHNGQLYPSIDLAVKTLGIKKTTFHYHVNKQLLMNPEAIRFEVVVNDLSINVSVISFNNPNSIPKERNK